MQTTPIEAPSNESPLAVSEELRGTPPTVAYYAILNKISSIRECLDEEIRDGLDGHSDRVGGVVT